MIKKAELWLTGKKLTIILSVFGILWFLIVSGLTVLRYRCNFSSAYDFGIFSQMYYYMDKIGLPLTTCERGGLYSHFRVHVSPIFYLLLPIYKVAPFNETLLVMQALLVISGLLPLCLLCRKLGFSNLATLILGLIYCTYPALLGGCFYDFHENKFLTVLILWTLYFLEIKKYGFMLFFSLLILLVKEDAPVYAACIGLFVFLYKKEYRYGTILFLGSCLYFCLVIWYLNRFGNGAMVNRFDNYISNKEMGLVSIFKTVLVNPAYVLSQIAVKDKLLFLLQMILPLGFLPFMTKHWQKWTLMIPFILINLMSNYPYQHSIDFQYTYGSAALLFYLAASNYKELKAGNSFVVLLSALICSISIFCITLAPKTFYLELYHRQKTQIVQADQLLRSIPDTASVKASTFFIPKLSLREEIYLINNEHQAEYIVLDLRNGKEKYGKLTLNDYMDTGYTIEGTVPNYLMILKSPSPPL